MDAKLAEYGANGQWLLRVDGSTGLCGFEVSLRNATADPVEVSAVLHRSGDAPAKVDRLISSMSVPAVPAGQPGVVQLLMPRFRLDAERFNLAVTMRGRQPGGTAGRGAETPSESTYRWTILVD